MLNLILNSIFPNRCLGCNSIIPPTKVVCELCFSQIHFTHYNFTDNHFFKNKCQLLFPTEHAFALMKFNENTISREIIHHLKYKGREKLGHNIAEWTIKKLNFKNKIPDIIVDVPLHRYKLKKRGYNQLHLFTEELSKHYNIPYNHDIFKRNINSKAQALKNKLGRQKNKNLFSLHQKITNQHILLVDDVFTTGSTISNLAWQLIHQGNKVSVLVMAIDL